MFQILWLQEIAARLVPIAWVGLLISLFLIFGAPLQVSTRRWFFRRPMSLRERTLVAWVGLRGGRADYSCHVSLSGRDREGRHDFSFGVLYSPSPNTP